jgi:hypothetical protein
MDYAAQQALTACGTCGLQESQHQGAVDEAVALDVLAALGGACRHFSISEAALRYQRHLNIAQQGPQPWQRRRKSGPVCGRCGNRGHQREKCPL